MSLSWPWERLGIPPELLEEVCLHCCPRDPATDKWKKMDGSDFVLKTITVFLPFPQTLYILRFRLALYTTLLLTFVGSESNAHQQYLYLKCYRRIHIRKCAQLGLLIAVQSAYKRKHTPFHKINSSGCIPKNKNVNTIYALFYHKYQLGL